MKRLGRPLDLLRSLRFRLSGRVIKLKSFTAQPKGVVLISYTTLPFLDTRPECLAGHTNRWECMEIVKIFRERGYDVDVIDFFNHTFIPTKDYSYALDLGENLEHFASYLPESCVKILHLTGSYWKFQNDAEVARIEALFARTDVHIAPQRQVAPNNALAFADRITLLGNDVTARTYSFADKQITRIPVSTTHTYPPPNAKDFAECRSHFVWFAGAGSIHKGLDLVLEAFRDTPEHSLSVCGKLDSDVRKLYKKELFDTPNIQCLGFIDPGSEPFEHLRNSAAALIYPSCSEGQAGSVVLSMHAGFIPIVSKESGVDTLDFGITLPENSISEIQAACRTIASAEPHELQERAFKAWQYARTYHTREAFSRAFREFVSSLKV